MHCMQVIGEGGKPVAGVTVTAFASSIPDESQKSDLPLSENRGDYPFPGERHATLAHATVDSDEQGVATFKELTVLGTSDEWVYISFFANGKLLSWSKPFDNYDIPKFATPLRAVSNIAVNVSKLPSSVVMEGRPFERQPEVTVTPKNPIGKKVYAGRIVYAIVVAKDGLARPGKITRSVH